MQRKILLQLATQSLVGNDSLKKLEDEIRSIDAVRSILIKKDGVEVHIEIVLVASTHSAMDVIHKKILSSVKRSNGLSVLRAQYNLS